MANILSPKDHTTTEGEKVPVVTEAEITPDESQKLASPILPSSALSSDQNSKENQDVTDCHVSKTVQSISITKNNSIPKPRITKIAEFKNNQKKNEKSANEATGNSLAERWKS